jgi:ABC-type antimicrobial peptide transport system permease subunit
MAPAATGVSGALTDGTGVSSLTIPKVIKDLILDALLSIPPSLLVINVTTLDAAIVAPVAVAFAVGDSLIRVVYRFLLKWAQT